MRKILFLILATVMIFAVAILPAFALAEPAEAIEAAEPTEVVETVDESAPVPGKPLTWQYLVTISGATAATLLIVQYFKVKLDKVWKIPTRVFVYFIAFVILLLATYFTQGLTVENSVLTVLNAFVVAVAAFGAYEITFKKMGW